MPLSQYIKKRDCNNCTVPSQFITFIFPVTDAFTAFSPWPLTEVSDWRAGGVCALHLEILGYTLLKRCLNAYQIFPWLTMTIRNTDITRRAEDYTDSAPNRKDRRSILEHSSQDLLLCPAIAVQWNPIYMGNPLCVAANLSAIG